MGKSLVLPAEFRPWQETELHAKVAGYLKRIDVDSGSLVQAGQVVAELEIPESAAEIQEAEANILRAQSENLREKAQIERARAQAKLTAEAVKRLRSVNTREPGLIAQQEVDEAEARAAVAAAEVQAAEAAAHAGERQIEAAKARLARLKNYVDYQKITAPFTGVVVKRHVHPGAMIQAAPVVRVAQVDKLRLVVVLPEGATNMVHTGQTVDILVTALNKELSGKVARMTQQVLTESRTMEAEIDIPNGSGELRPGMAAEVRLRAVAPAQVLAVPVQAVAHRGGNHYLWVVGGDGKVSERQVETGLEDGGSIQILSGAETGDRVVVGNKTMLRPGQKVETKVQTGDGAVG